MTMRGNFRFFSAFLAVALLTQGRTYAEDVPQPNILWIVTEDASPHIGCYGESTIETPHLDHLASEGVRFANAFVTCPVCSPSRSAMVTGMFQTTLGTHNHRSSSDHPKASGNISYYDSYRMPKGMKSIPELFAEEGYFVVNGGTSKTDYNFIPRGNLYHGKDWAARTDGQPFFAQIQLTGGKARKARVSKPVDPATVHLPAYYPDDTVFRDDWARYLNSWIKTDREVGEILDRLKQNGLDESTVVFFWCDHGISHLRGKQFLYDEGIRVPLIVRFSDGRDKATVRSDLVTNIDIAATSLHLAGIPIPNNIQGRALFAPDHQPRDLIYSARDRCDETVDIIRCVRSQRYKYIRNFVSFRSHCQPNQYKDGKSISIRIRELERDGTLSPLQSRILKSSRPTEELYDLQSDPLETKNLADDPRYVMELRQMRNRLYGMMIETRDLGLIPEPILEDLGKEFGSKYAVLQDADNQHLIQQLIDVIEAGEQGRQDDLERAALSSRPAVRYWAATGLETPEFRRHAPV